MTATRVLLLSDTHGVLDPRIAELAGECDIVAHAGDIGSVDVLEALRARCGTLFAVRGNNDAPGKCSGRDVELARLPRELELELPGGVLAVTHGDAHPARDRHARLRAAWPQARAVFYGHSHRASIDRASKPWVLNAGAAGRQRTFGGPSCLLLSVGQGRWQVQLRKFP